MADEEPPALKAIHLEMLRQRKWAYEGRPSTGTLKIWRRRDPEFRKAEMEALQRIVADEPIPQYGPTPDEVFALTGRSSGAWNLETVAHIRACILVGMGRVETARNARIAYSTFHAWMQEKPEFRTVVEWAEAESERIAAATLHSASVTDWKAAVALLERRFSDRWKLKNESRVNATMLAAVGTVQQLLDALPPDEQAGTKLALMEALMPGSTGDE
jgi:hypothetical protein